MLLVTAPVPDPPGALLAAAGAPGHLLITSDASVACYAATTAPGAAADDAPALRRLWQQPAGGGRVEFAAPLSLDAYLLVTSSGRPGAVHAAVVQVLPTSQHILAAAELPCGEQPCQRPVFSNLAPCGDGNFMLTAALWQGTMHVLHAERGSGGTWRLAASPSPLGDLLTAEPGGLSCVQTSTRAHFALCRSPLKAGRCPDTLSVSFATVQAQCWRSSRWRWAPPARSLRLTATCTPSCCTPLTAWAAAGGRLCGMWPAWSCSLRTRPCTAAAGS